MSIHHFIVGAPTITKAYLANRIVTVEWMVSVYGSAMHFVHFHNSYIVHCSISTPSAS